LDSRKRVIAIINDVKTFLGNSFPNSNGQSIPKASLTIDGGPQPSLVALPVVAHVRLTSSE
jgi:hypothetical protein